jgi:hypothetical protein
MSTLSSTGGRGNAFRRCESDRQLRFSQERPRVRALLPGGDNREYDRDSVVLFAPWLAAIGLMTIPSNIQSGFENTR